MAERPNLSPNFLHACQSGNLSKVQALVSRHNVQDWTVFRHVTSGDTPLHVAAREGHSNVVRYLCEAFEEPKFKIDVRNKDTKTPLHDAAQFSRNDTVKYLISKGASVDSLKRADWTPLMLACTKTGLEARECISALLEAKANPFLRNKDGWTPLLLACRSGDEDAFRLLTVHSTNCMDDRSNNGRSAAHIAAFHGHRGIIDSIAAFNLNLLQSRDSSGSTPLHEAIKGGHLKVVERIRELGVDVRAMDNIGQTILHVAALTGNTEIVEYILQNKLIDVDSEDSFGATPLVVARRSNVGDIVECLTKYGARK